MYYKTFHKEYEDGVLVVHLVCQLKIAVSQ